MTNPQAPDEASILAEVSKGLNPAQLDAVTGPDGPTLVLAGAGSGKTRSIIHRVAFLIGVRRVQASSILALTFTNRAASEVRRRVHDLLGPGVSAPQRPGVFTFHALAMRLLRQFGEDVGLAKGFTLYATDERKRLLRRVCQDFAISERDLSLARIGQAVSSLKHEGYGRKLRFRDERERHLLTSIAAEYQTRMQQAGAVDFDDLLLRTVELLECSEACQRFASERFQHVLVDEYQDTNRIQYRLLRLLAPHGNLFVVGDDDQSIYNFRGADLRNILDFERDFKNARTVKLEQNYRSTKAILDVANSVIANNQDRKGKILYAAEVGGDPPEVWELDNEIDEAEQIAEEVARLRSGSEPASVGILFRTHAQSRSLEEELLKRNLPHVVVGGMRFYERKEIVDAVAYLKLLLNPNDDGSFARVVNVPSRGVGKTTLAAIESRAGSHGVSSWEAATQLVEANALSGVGKTGVREFLRRMSSLRELAPTLAVSELVGQVLELTGLLRAFDKEGPEQAEQRRENLFQLVAAAEELEQSSDDADLALFVDNLSLFSDLDSLEDQAPCLLMTLHSAKGLEFDAVFLPGMEEGLFPHIRSVANLASLEEERRLCYVGMTRAKTRLIMTHARSRRAAYQMNGREPSRFLNEVPQGLMSVRQIAPNRPSLPWGRDAASPGRTRGRERRDDAAGSKPGSRSAIRSGMKVRHGKFGEGLVVSTSGRGPDQRVVVQFHRAGRKRLVAQYARLEILR